MAMINNPAIERRKVADRRASASLRHLTAADWVAMVLLIVGGVNWGLIGLMNIDLVAMIFGDMTVLARLVYLAVGAAGLYGIYTCIRLSGNSRRTDGMSG